LKQKAERVGCMNRREFLSAAIAGCVGLLCGGAAVVGGGCSLDKATADTFIAGSAGMMRTSRRSYTMVCGNSGYQSKRFVEKESFSNQTLLNPISSDAHQH